MSRILLVDDDTSVLKLLVRALPGYELSMARDGGEAWAAANLGKPDLLITDYMMPTLFGDELIGHLRERWPDLKVLVLTAHSDVLDQEAPEWWCSEAHLAKPFQVDALQNTVAAMMEDRPLSFDAAVWWSVSPSGGAAGEPRSERLVTRDLA
jgi:CheY-like chemotaxis protein